MDTAREKLSCLRDGDAISCALTSEEVKVKLLCVKDKHFVAFRTTLKPSWYLKAPVSGHLCRAPPADQWKNDEVTARYNTVITANAKAEDFTFFPFVFFEKKKEKRF